MRLNAQTDYSLRMMMFLAVRLGEPTTIQEIATRLSLSQTHLMRVAAKLSAKGFVASTRGRTGGIMLSRNPTEITIEQVVQAIEPDFHLAGCFDPSRKDCSIEPACRLKGALSAALEAFFAELATVTLADLAAPNRAQLIHLFNTSEFRRAGKATHLEVFN